MVNLGKFAKPFQGSEIERTAKRFPFAVFCMFVFFFVYLDAEKFHLFFKDFSYSDILEKILFALASGYFAGGCIRLVAESRGWNRLREFLLTVALTGVVAVGIMCVPTVEYRSLWICFFLLFVMVAPFLSRERDDVSFWCYNYEVWYGFAIAFISALLLAGGLQVAFVAIDYLFGLETSREVSVYIWSFAASIFAPFYVLSCVPQNLRFESEACDRPMAALSFILNWLLAPLAIVYFLILYAYAAKIIVQMELPKGQLAYMITGFGGTGALIYLLGWPLRDKGTRLLKFLYNNFFKMLILPIVLLSIGIGTRISEYGVTEDRYIVALGTVWFAGLCAIYAFRQRPLKWMPLTLLILFGVAVSGPWGAVPVSTYSQTARLEALLAKNGILVGGKIIPAESDIPFEDEKSITSIVEYLIQSEKEKFLPRVTVKDSYGSPSVSEYLNAMGLEYVSSYQLAKDATLDFSVTYNRNPVTPVKGYSYIVNDVSEYQAPPGVARSHDADLPIYYTLEKGVLTAMVRGQGTLAFDISTVATEDAAGMNKPDPLVIEAQNGKLKGKLLIRRLQYKMGPPFEANSIGFDLLLDY